MRRFITLVAMVAMLGYLPARAYGDPIRVTSGVFDLDLEGDVLIFFGADFELSHWPLGPGDPNIFLHVPKLFTSPSCTGSTDTRCAPGETVNLSFRTPGEEFLGTGRAVIGGTTYSDVTFRGSLDFRAEDAVLPLVSGDFHNATAPFVFNGTIRGLNGMGAELFTVSLFGNGRTFDPFFRSGDTYFAEETGSTFIFEETAPTPEPGTMVLFGLGAAALARRMRTRRS